MIDAGEMYLKDVPVVVEVSIADNGMRNNETWIGYIKINTIRTFISSS
jgi:hypothetical protein